MSAESPQPAIPKVIDWRGYGAANPLLQADKLSIYSINIIF